MLLALLTKLGSRCCVEERGSQAWCRCTSGPADEPPMTASGGNLIGGEIRRNEQCPLCGLATIEPAERAAIPDAKHPGKTWEKYPGESSLSPGYFSQALLGQKPTNFPYFQRNWRKQSFLPNLQFRLNGSRGLGPWCRCTRAAEALAPSFLIDIIFYPSEIDC